MLSICKFTLHCGVHSVKLGSPGHARLPAVWSQPPLENKADLFSSGGVLMCGHIFFRRRFFFVFFCQWPSLYLMTHRSPPHPATRWCISFPMSLGWLTNAGYSHMLLLLFLIHYTAHMSRFASSCSLNKQQRHSTAVAKSLWTKLLPLAHHGFNYVLENIKQVGQFVVGNHISIERAKDITNDL